MRALVFERPAQPAERRAAEERSTHGREAAARRHDFAFESDHARSGNTGARMRFDERAQLLDDVRHGDRVRVREQDEVARRLGDAAVGVRGEALRALVVQDPNAGRNLADASRHVGDHDQLVHLRRERR